MRSEFIRAYRQVTQGAYGAGMKPFFDRLIDGLTDSRIAAEMESLKNDTPTGLLINLGAKKLSGDDQVLLCGMIVRGDFEGIRKVFELRPR